MNAPANCLSRLHLGFSVEPVYDRGDLACTTVFTEDFSELETHFVLIATYLSALLTDCLRKKIRRKTRENSKKTAVWTVSLFRCVRGSLRLTPHKHLRGLLIKLYHQNTGHWDKKATVTLRSDRVWWQC